MKNRSRFLLPTLLGAATVAAGGLHAQEPAYPRIKANRLPESPGNNAPTTRPLDRAALSGDVQLSIQLSKPSLATRQADATAAGAPLSGDAQRTYLGELAADQASLSSRLDGLGARRLATLGKALNSVLVTVDARKIDEIAKLPGVKSVRRINDYKLDLSETVPYIGAAAAQQNGFTGAGIRVAVLDSGIDYTHRNLAGAGTPAAYTAAYGAAPGDSRNVTLDGLFPTAKVVAGFDFVGEAWTGGLNTPPTTDDADPIDFEGHGTHVADIIAGESLDGAHKGVAPGARLVAVKVCSAVGSACNGVALLRGIDFALDPDADGDISDRVDIINMSLGSSFGQTEDDLSQASANAVRVGVSVVVSAGNSADRPYIVGSPSSTPEVISVAQTSVPSAQTFPLVVNDGAAQGTYPNTNTVPFPNSQPGAPVTATLLYVGRGCPASVAANGTPVPADSLPTGVTEADVAGKVVLIDRGVCGISLKIDRFADLGAVGVILANNAAGDPPSFSFAGPDPGYNGVPTLVVTNTVGFGPTSTLRQALTSAAANGQTVSVTISNQNPASLAGSMASSSSRGPSISFQAIKPEIGAPGASISAIAGGATTEEAFGGTSGAAPMVAGSVALLKEGFVDASPLTVKSLLMNNAFRDVTINPASQPGVLAPITRIGAGEVRVDKSLNAGAFAYVVGTPDTPSLSFGFERVSGPRTYTKTVRVRNLLPAARTFNITSAFRFADDANNGAVTISAPTTVAVPGRRTADFTVTLTVDPTRLPVWTLNGGAAGGDGFRLQGVEYDGFVQIAEGGDTLAMPFHYLPHRAAGTRAASSNVTLTSGAGSVAINNAAPSALAGTVAVFSLIGTSPRVPVSTLPKSGDNFAIVDLQSVGVRVVNFGTAMAPNLGLQFAVTSHDQRSNPIYPGGYEIDIDLDNNGTVDYAVFQEELTSFGATGQAVVAVFRVSDSTVTRQQFLDADFNSSFAIFNVPFTQLGLPATTAPSTPMGLTFFGIDNYFTGNVTDSIVNVTYTPGTPKYTFSLSATPVPIGGSSPLSINANPGGAAASPSQLGALLIYRDNRSKLESQTIRVSP